MKTTNPAATQIHGRRAGRTRGASETASMKHSHVKKTA
jgi:hypothetical protein